MNSADCAAMFVPMAIVCACMQLRPFAKSFDVVLRLLLFRHVKVGTLTLFGSNFSDTSLVGGKRWTSTASGTVHPACHVA